MARRAYMSPCMMFLLYIYILKFGILNFDSACLSVCVCERETICISTYNIYIYIYKQFEERRRKWKKKKKKLRSSDMSSAIHRL